MHHRHTSGKGQSHLSESHTIPLCPVRSSRSCMSLCGEFIAGCLGWQKLSGKLSLLGCCGFAYFGLGNLWYHLGEEDKPLWGPVECWTCNYVETGTASADPAKTTPIMSVETPSNLKLSRHRWSQKMTKNLHWNVSQQSLCYFWTHPSEESSPLANWAFLIFHFSWEWRVVLASYWTLSIYMLYLHYSVILQWFLKHDFNKKKKMWISDHEYEWIMNTWIRLYGLMHAEF